MVEEAMVDAVDVVVKVTMVVRVTRITLYSEIYGTLWTSYKH